MNDSKYSYAGFNTSGGVYWTVTNDPANDHISAEHAKLAGIVTLHVCDQVTLTLDKRTASDLIRILREVIGE